MKLKFNKSKVSKIEKSITKLVQNEIKSKDLINTGSLLKSIKSKLTFKGSNFSIAVEGNNYYKYLDDTYSITKDAFNGPAYEKVVGEIEDMYAEAIEDSLGI